MKGRPSLSVCMIVKDEERDLPRLFSSIKGLADEIIVVDTGSGDETVEIARQAGALVCHFPWCDDFSAARNESIRHATGDYILWLDADDEVKTGEHGKIRGHLRKHRGTAVFLRLRNITETGETEATQLRVFPNHRGISFSGRVHEQIYSSVQKKNIPFSWCDAIVYHHGYAHMNDMTAKLQRNKRIQLKELEDDPDNIYTLFFLARSHIGLGETEEALERYRRFIELAENRGDITDLDIYKTALLDVSEILCNQHRIGEAVEMLEESLARFPGHKLFSYGLGRILFQEKDYEKTYDTLLPIRDYGFENELVPLDIKVAKAVLFRCLGISAIFCRKYDTAVSCLEDLVALAPEGLDNYHYLSLAREESGDMEGAVEACDRGIALFPDDAYLKKRRFILLAKTDDIESALSARDSLNGHGVDMDVLSADFLTRCRTFDFVEINRVYREIQEELSLTPQPFPEGIEEVRKAVAAGGEGRAAGMLDEGIALLLDRQA